MQRKAQNTPFGAIFLILSIGLHYQFRHNSAHTKWDILTFAYVVAH
jgi:hypothetical protein